MKTVDVGPYGDKTKHPLNVVDRTLTCGICGYEGQIELSDILDGYLNVSATFVINDGWNTHVWGPCTNCNARTGFSKLFKE